MRPAGCRIGRSCGASKPEFRILTIGAPDYFRFQFTASTSIRSPARVRRLTSRAFKSSHKLPNPFIPDRDGGPTVDGYCGSSIEVGGKVVTSGFLTVCRGAVNDRPAP